MSDGYTVEDYIAASAANIKARGELDAASARYGRAQKEFHEAQAACDLAQYRYDEAIEKLREVERAVIGDTST